MTPRALAYLLAANFLGGSSYVATARALEGATPAVLSFWRLLIGAVVFLPFVVRGLRRMRPSAREWLGMAGVGVFGLAAPLVLGALGQTMSTATNASLLIGMEPLSVVVMSALFLGEEFSLLKGGAVALGLAGSSIIVLQGPPWAAALAPHWRGDLLLALQGFLWALYSVIGKPVLRRVDPMTFCGLTTLIALPVVALGALRDGIHVPAAHLGAVAYLALGVTVLGVVTWNKALEEVPASLLANFIFLQPLIGVVLGVLILGDPFTRWSALGGATIMGGVYLATFQKAPGKAAELALQ